VYGKAMDYLQADAKYKISLPVLSKWFAANKLSLSLNTTYYTVFGGSSEESLSIDLSICNRAYSSLTG